MFDWFNRDRSRSPRRANRGRPEVERLELRECLAAPQMTLAIAFGAQRTVILSGTVTDESPGTTLVTFGGQAAGAVIPDVHGNFSFHTQATALGAITAVAVDNETLASNLAQVMVASHAPAISNFTAVNLGGNIWKFTGQVTDENPQGLVVRLNGTRSLPNLPVVVGANGWFTITLSIPPHELGHIATAVVDDWWGLGSNVAQALIE